LIIIKGDEERMINKEITKKLGNLQAEKINLIETDVSKMLDVHLAVVKKFNDKGYSEIILSTSRPSKNLLDLYKENKIDTDKLMILDTFGSDKKEPERSNIIRLSNSSSLTEISLSLSKCIETIKGKKFFFIDSINTMLIHNDPNILAKFFHFVLTKMRVNNIGGILILIEKDTNKEVSGEIAQLCDKILKV